MLSRKKAAMTTNKIIIDNCRNVLPRLKPHSFDLAFLDPPYEDHALRDYAIQEAMLHLLKAKTAIVCFMYPEDIMSLKFRFDQIAHWLKPISTKNTTRKYSSFIEAIAIKHGAYFNQDLHWSSRTGVFTDSIIVKAGHPHQKPASLVEKLLRLHCPIGGYVIDPFGGSGIVCDVAEKIGINSLSIEINRSVVEFTKKIRKR